MARSPNRSEPVKVTITLPSQTHAYLVKLASVGALGQNEAFIAGQIVTHAVEHLMRERRAETVLSVPVPPDDHDA
jgi:hypothetical protein